MTPARRLELLGKALAEAPSDQKLLYAYAYCGLVDTALTDIVLATLRRRLAQSPPNEAIRLNELALYAYMLETRRRRAEGLSSTSARNVEDLNFQFARQELTNLIDAASLYLPRYPTDFGAGVLLAEGFASLGMMPEAEGIFSQLRKFQHDNTAVVTCFDPAFHATLEGAALRAVEDCAPVTCLIDPPSSPQRLIFVSADHDYFQRYGWALVESLQAQGDKGFTLALHVMDMTPAEGEALVTGLARFGGLQISLSTEWSGLRSDEKTAAARGYYHAMRLLRFWQVLRMYPQAAAWMLDVDQTFNLPPQALFDLLPDHDIALGLSPGRFDVRNKVLACFVGAAATPLARSYIQRAAGYIVHFAGNHQLVWGIDQVALYAVLMDRVVQNSGMRVASIPPFIGDGRRDETRVLWSGKQS